MPWGGSAGSKTYSRTDGTRSGSTTWQQADNAGVDIISPDHDTHDQDMADAISATLLKDGGNTATANLPMGGFRHTNTGAAVARSDYARFSDHQDGKGIYCPTVGGSANVITLTTGYSVSAYAAGQRFTFLVGTTNTGAATVNVDSQGAKSIVRSDGANTALAAGDLVAGMMAEIVYDGTRFHLMSTQVASAASGDVLARIIKVGSVVPWPMTTVPTGWLEADGSAVSRTTYAELYAVYGTAYGVGDGSTTFNLPNYKDYFLRGFDAAGTDAASRTDRGDGTTGAAVGTKQAAATAAHTHTGTTNATAPTIQVANVPQSTTTFQTPGGVAAGISLGTQNATGTSHTHAFTTDSTGGTETRPKNITVKFIILALPAAASASTIGVNGLMYAFDTGTSDADPGAGLLRFNNATVSSATKLYINETGANSEGLGAVLATWDDSTSTTKGDLYIYKVGAPGTYAYFQITGSVTDAGSYDKFDLTYVGHNGSFASGDNLSVLFIRNGSKGDTGATGSTGATGVDAGIRWNFDSSTSMADPGTGDIRLNNATLASVTAIAVSDLCAESGNPDVSTFVLAWDDSTNTSLRGTLVLKKTTASQNFAIYSITGASTDNSGWTQLAVTHVQSSGSFSNADPLSVAFTRTGNVGAAIADGDYGDITVSSSGTAFTIDNSAVTNAKLANMAEATIKGRASGAGTGAPVDLTATQATAILNAVVGDSGSGGTKGLVPAPAAGDAAANKFLKADGTWTSPSGSGDVSGGSASTDGEVVLYSGTGGKTIKRSNTISGLAKLASGVLSAAASGTDYAPATSGSSVLKGNGSGGFSSAAATDLGAGTHTIYVPAAAMLSRTTNGAASGTVETTTNKVMIRTLDFDTTTQEFAQFSIRMPKSWNESTVTASFTWSHASTTTNFGVVWALEAVAISDADALDAAFGTAQQVADTGGTTNTAYITSATSAITIAGTPQAEDWVVFQVKRVPSDGSDTMAVDARLHGVTVYITTDAITDA